MNWDWDDEGARRQPARQHRALFVSSMYNMGRLFEIDHFSVKKSAITHSIRLLQNKIRECAISLLIMNTRAFLSLIVGINPGESAKTAQSHEVPPKGGGPALSLVEGGLVQTGGRAVLRLDPRPPPDQCDQRTRSS